LIGTSLIDSESLVLVALNQFENKGESMNRKDYIAIAEKIQLVRQVYENTLIDKPITNIALDKLVDHLCVLFEEDNPNFDEVKFRKACEIV
jgi:hypothetical protein